jgi:SAM-dependent methyltransferase
VTDLLSLRGFYLSKSDGQRGVFHLSENGGAVGDSVTRSTYSPSYQHWMEDLLHKLLDGAAWPGLLSVGCGNAVIEAAIHAAGYRVLGVDALGEAVELAVGKGIEAVCADVMTWTPPPGPWSVLYADGVLGHLYEPEQGLQPTLRRFRSWLPSGGILVISNDGPRTAVDIEQHPSVAGFTWLSGRYLLQQVEAAGFHEANCTLTYQRPVTGPRERVVVTGLVP